MFERLAEIDRKFIKEKVLAGYYTSEIELVRDAIRKMREEDERQQRMEALHDLIAAGHTQAVEGQVASYSNDFVEKALERAKSKHQAGEPIKDVIKPT